MDRSRRRENPCRPIDHLWYPTDRIQLLSSVHDHWYHCRRSAPLRKRFLTSTQIRPYGLVLLSAVLPVGAFFLIDQAITTATQ